MKQFRKIIWISQANIFISKQHEITNTSSKYDQSDFPITVPPTQTKQNHTKNKRTAKQTKTQTHAEKLTSQPIINRASQSGADSYTPFSLFMAINGCSGSDLYSEDETRHGFPDPIGDSALPKERAMEWGDLSRWRRWWRGSQIWCGWWRCLWVSSGNSSTTTEARDAEGCVEVLPDLGYYPMSDGPGVDPSNGARAVTALCEDGGPKRSNCLWNESEGGRSGTRWGVRRRRSTSEKAHQELVGRRTVEPPLQIRGYEFVHRCHVTRAQGIIQGEYHPSITRITFLQNFLRVSQF